MLRGVGPLLRSAHLEPSLAVTLAAAALAIGAGLGPRTWLVAFAVGAGQVSIGWSNDWLDQQRDAAGGRRDKPVAQHEISARVVAAAAVVAAMVCVVASLALGIASTGAHLTGVAAGWLYNARAKHSWYSVVPWAVAFGLLPAVVTLTAPLLRWPAWWVIVAGALLGAGAHFANAIPDLQQDRDTGVEGLPQRLGRKAALRCAIALVGAGIAVVTLGPGPRPAGVAVGVLGGGVLLWVVRAAWRGDDRAAFRGVVALLLLLTFGLVTSGAALY